MTLGPAPKCLQSGAPACPELYEEWWSVPVPIYVEVALVDGTSVLQEKGRRLVRYDQRLHIGLAQCLLGLDHEGGHLTDTRHGRIRWWIERWEEFEEDEDGIDAGRDSDPAAEPQ